MPSTKSFWIFSWRTWSPEPPPTFSVPIEIVHQIILYALLSAPKKLKSAKSSKPDWKLIEAFTLASWSYRYCALSVWFRTFYTESAEDLEDLVEIFPQIRKTWTRRLHCVQPNNHEEPPLVWDLVRFKRLSAVRIDWLLTLSLLEDQGHRFENVPSTLKELDICGLRNPSPMDLLTLTTPFQHITKLQLEALRSWCGLCHTTALIQFKEPNPRDIVYKGGLGLSVHYSRVLHSLQHLEEVTISLPYFHALLTEGIPANAGDDFWTGECDQCMRLMYGDAEFKQSYMERKRGVGPAGCDERVLYRKPPALKRVRWTFWDYNAESDKRSYTRAEFAMELGDLYDSDAYDA